MTLISRLFNIYNLKHAGRIISPFNFENPFQKRDFSKISHRFTIGRKCKKQCKRPKTCRELARDGAHEAPMPHKFPCHPKRGSASDHKKDKFVIKPLPCTEERCLPFRYIPPTDLPPACPLQLKKCHAGMVHHNDHPPPKDECFAAKGKIKFTTNERPRKNLPSVPTGDWNYTDEYLLKRNC